MSRFHLSSSQTRETSAGGSDGRIAVADDVNTTLCGSTARQHQCLQMEPPARARSVFLDSLCKYRLMRFKAGRLVLIKRPSRAKCNLRRAQLVKRARHPQGPPTGGSPARQADDVNTTLCGSTARTSAERETFLLTTYWPESTESSK